ncbi:VTT domain-containing protein [Longimicrobium terrae]|uniref:Membrane protein DedA with SNARE-associated domain n=1 Tax=Longimicrobium terrae TaxID=1639882 RepID=A0A841H3I2_9BACT|nr:membrane protein DedA with SNARE-associated domain [Longimicrobium terrae]MBB6072533.1 membrane protein DedA with SNARE-associated domain [Longimicrobium terrae]NNC28686.1 DedA family protein [Longimicrobium terrae]
MLGFVTGLLDSLGYVGLVLLMFLENVFPPIPSELIMPLAGYTATRGQFAIAGVIVAGTVGSVLGALPLYWLGRRVGQDRLRTLADRHGRWLAVSPDEIDRASSWFSRHGRWVILFGRLVPGVRSLISIPAGINRMPLVPFLLLTTLGSGVWTAILALLGYQLGSRFGEVETYLSPASNVILGLMAAAYLWRVIRPPRRRTAGGNAAHRG